ncbi:MAG: ABC transporter permease [Bacteroidota bacterium]
MGGSPWLTPRRRRALAQEVEEELQLHLALRAAENERDGMEAVDALADAHDRFGDIDAIREACLDAEDDHPLRLASRAALRVGMLAVGFGAIALAFALVQSVLLQPLRFQDADRLVRFGEGWDDARIQASTFAEWRDRSTSFEILTALDATEIILTGNGFPLPIQTMRIGDGFFDVFGIAPILGRTFTAEEVEAAPQPVVLLSEALWETRYRRSPTILGRSIPLDGEPHTVVGVMPGQAQLSHRVDVWTPLLLDPASSRQQVYAVGQMRSGVLLQDVREEMAALTDALAIPDAAARRAGFHPLHDLYATPIRSTVLLLLVVGGLMLVLVWASVVRGTFDRSPLGRAQPVASSRQVWNEAFAVAGSGAVLGGLLAAGAHRLTYDVMFERWGSLFAPSGGAVIAAVAGLALATAVGLVMAQRITAGHALRRWSERVLTVAITAATVVLLVVVVQQHRAAWSEPVPVPSLEERDLFLSVVTLPGGLPEETVQERMEGLLHQVRAVPGVASASLGWTFPIAVERIVAQPVVLDVGASERSFAATIDLMGETYTETLGLTLLEGREAREGADASTLEAVVSAAFAAQAWPGQSALGRRIDIGDDGLVRTVVGVVDDLYDIEADVPVVSVPYGDFALPRAVLFVRGAIAADPVVRRTAFAADPDVAVQPFVAVADVRMAGNPATRTRLILLSVLALLGLATVMLTILQRGLDQMRRRGGDAPAVGRLEWADVGMGIVLGVGAVVVATHELVWLGDLDRATVGAVALGTGLVLTATSWLVNRQVVE